MRVFSFVSASLLVSRDYLLCCRRRCQLGDPCYKRSFFPCSVYRSSSLLFNSRSVHSGYRGLSCPGGFASSDNSGFSRSIIVARLRAYHMLCLSVRTSRLV
ncbi:hypothetical protein OG21DRAFT_379097 [Imleria badia]|nr:hypothetical protein OG21DRAFT_379097 [Imleria badia]